MFLTKDNLIIKTQFMQGIIDHDAAVFVEGINIKATLNKKKKCRMVPLYRKTNWDVLKNTCRLFVHSTTCDLSKNDYLWSSFWEKLTSSIKRFIPHTSTRKSNLQLLVSLSYYLDNLKPHKGHWAWWLFSHSPLRALSLVTDNSVIVCMTYHN